MRDFGGNGAGGGRRQAEQEDDETGAPGDAGAAARDVNWTDVDQQLRGAVRRLSYAAEKMEALPEGCTFTVAVELKEEGQAPIGVSSTDAPGIEERPIYADNEEHPQAWIPSEPNLQTASTTIPENGRDIGGAKTTSIRAVEAGPLFFECWVEEGKAKDALREDTQSQEQTHSSAS